MSGSGGFGIARVLICEDEPLAVRALREYLKDVDWIEIVGEARTGSDAVRLKSSSRISCFWTCVCRG